MSVAFPFWNAQSTRQKLDFFLDSFHLQCLFTAFSFLFCSATQLKFAEPERGGRRKQRQSAFSLFQEELVSVLLTRRPSAVKVLLVPLLLAPGLYSAWQNLITEIIIVTCTVQLLCFVIKSCIGRCECAANSEKLLKAYQPEAILLQLVGPVLLGFYVSTVFGDLEDTPEPFGQGTDISCPVGISSADSGLCVAQTGHHGSFKRAPWQFSIASTNTWSVSYTAFFWHSVEDKLLFSGQGQALCYWWDSVCWAGCRSTSLLFTTCFIFSLAQSYKLAFGPPSQPALANLCPYLFAIAH